jgi:AAA family ATP:ADP antiporter
VRALVTFGRRDVKTARRGGKLLLGLFGDVRRTEIPTVVLLSTNVLLLLAAYYLLKVAREPLILMSGGAEVKSYAAAGQSVILIGVSSGYGWLSARVGRTLLISVVTLFFVANLGVFWALGSRGQSIGLAFFLWVGIFNVVTVAQFWSFAADVYDDADGKRLFPVIGIGSSLGAVAGAVLATLLIKQGSPFRLMLVSAGMLLSALLLTHAVHRLEPGRAKRHGGGPLREQPFPRSDVFGLVLRDRYLVVLALLVLVLSVVTKTGDYVLDRTLVLRAPREAQALGITAGAYIGQFKARYFQWITVLSVVLQALAVSRIIRRAGIRTALVLVPLASVGGYGVALFVPLVSVLFAGRVMESSVDYSLSNTTRQALWLVTSDEKKYKAKQVVDTFVVRAGDALSAGLVWVGATLLLGPRHFLALNLGFSLVWVVLAVALGRQYARR